MDAKFSSGVGSPMISPLMVDQSRDERVREREVRKK